MKSPTSSLLSENIRWHALVAGLALVLALLALLQYRSTRLVSDATTEHLRSTLQDSLMDLRQGVGQELKTLCEAFQSDAGVPRSSASQEYIRRLERWRRTAAHPALIGQVLVVRSLDVDEPELLELREDLHRASSAKWTRELLPLRAWMQKSPLQSLGYSGATATLDADGSGVSQQASAQTTSSSAISAATHPIFPWLIDESIPALIHAELEVDRDARGKTVTSVAWVVMRLDLKVLGHDVLPELVQRNFGRESEAAYRIAVISLGESTGPIYSSDGSFQGSDLISDASVNLFGRPEFLNREKRAPADPLPDTKPAIQLPLSYDPAGSRNQILKSDEDGPVHIDPIHYGDKDPDWHILAQHRQGSVEAAVASSYHRSLVINFGVLFLLGITMTLIIANSRRSRRLAQLQVDFVAGVSHELRTPLTGIVAAAQNIADGVVDDKPRVVRYGNAILTQAQQLADLVEQILLFSATQKNAHRYHLQLADVETILNACVKTTSTLTKPAGFSVQRTIQPGLPQVLVDTKALSQCLQNLITNAAKYSGASRWIGVEAVTATDPMRGSEVTIAVEDRGLGMEPEELLHIFKPFYRSPEVTAAQIHGNGLGLPLTKSMVEAMGGRLTVSSRPKEGSRFTIHLPIPRNGSQPSPASMSAGNANS
jgi:two-component system, OmpR family, sensor histidine kinase SenX3